MPSESAARCFANPILPWAVARSEDLSPTRGKGYLERLKARIQSVGYQRQLENYITDALVEAAFAEAEPPCADAPAESPNSEATGDEDLDCIERAKKERLEDEERRAERERERQLFSELRSCARDAVSRWNASEEEREDVEKYLIELGIDQSKVEVAVWTNTHRTIERIDDWITKIENRRIKAILFAAEHRRTSPKKIDDLRRRVIENDPPDPPRLT